MAKQPDVGKIPSRFDGQAVNDVAQAVENAALDLEKAETQVERVRTQLERVFLSRKDN